MSDPLLGAEPVQVICRQIEEEHAGYHVWLSDEGWWYAVKAGPQARGWAATVDGPGPVELEQALREAGEAA
jgi:hypothetical protein